MSFRTQRLANAFPLWSKLRSDPSSFGHRFLDTFASVIAEQSITNVKLSMDNHLLKPYLGIGYLYSVVLSDDDAFPQAETSLGVLQYSYPTVVGTVDSVDYTLDRYEDLFEMLSAAPDRVSLVESRPYTSLFCWQSSSPYVFSDPPWPERLSIEVSGSTFFSKPSKVYDREYSGMHAVHVFGTDQNDISISELVEVRDDGVYRTRNIFKTVEDISIEGFDGSVSVRWFPEALSQEPDPYRIAVFDDFEGQLLLSLSSQVVDSVTYSYVVYSSNRLKNGNDYRRPQIESPGNNEVLAETVLLDSSGSPYVAVDLAINHQSSKLYVLDDSGFVHVYDHELSPFSVFSSTESETMSTYIELTPLRHRAKFGDSEYLYTDFKRNRLNISSIQIKRRAPDGTVEYLQADRSTWAAGAASISAPVLTGLTTPEASWQDFRFSTTYNQVGQWEYVLTTKTAVDTTVYVTAVMASSMAAESSVDMSVSTPAGLSFSQEGYISISDGSEVHFYEEFVDGWIADTRLGQILMRSDYTSVEVTY